MSDTSSDSTELTHTPPLGHKALTPLYDIAIAALTRENQWREAFVSEIAPQANDHILDIGSGTGSLAVALCRQAPDIKYVGIDPDAEAVAKARQKNAAAETNADFRTGFFNCKDRYFDRPPNKIVSSLVLHQVPITEKKRIIAEIYDTLRPGGFVLIADYGLQKPALMRFLFRITVQALDGVADTQPNADGVLPEIIKDTGFENVIERALIPTPTGTISIYRGRKPQQPIS